ncbi:MAG: hypothetical protein OXN84_15785 [Albidovulum sp.]|nr:hypothetical protein [Albidovulum sp.]
MADVDIHSADDSRDILHPEGRRLAYENVDIDLLGAAFRPPFLKFAMFSFFFVSKKTTGWPSAEKMPTGG